jgi:hypothetical protein
MSTSAIQRAQPAANLLAAVTTAQIFALLASGVSIGAAAPPATACVLYVPGSKRLEQKRWVPRASGIVTTAGAFTAQVSLYGAVVPPTGAASLIAANWTLLGAGAAQAVGTTTAAWLIEAEMLFDSVSGKLQGTFNTNVNNTPVASAAIANQLTGINGATEPVLALAVGITFSSGNAGNIGVMADFALDA